MWMQTICATLLILFLNGCASWLPQGQQKQTGSVVEFLYGKKGDAVTMQPEMTTLRLPVHVGLAFVPPASWGQQVNDAEQMRMLGKVKDAFQQQDFIGAIEIIPSAYLRAGGGFTNLEQAARMFNVDVVALLSYDQVQFNDSNALSVLYWTLIGAYLIHGDQYDIHTLLEATVFDVASRKLLLRAPGISQVRGSAAMATFSERARAARIEGFDQALDDLIPKLHKSLDEFKQRVKTDGSVQFEHRAGYSGAGTLAWPELLLLMLAGVAIVRIHKPARAS